jgi:hypothetical protein
MNIMSGLGYKGKGATSSDVTSMKKKLAEARSWSQTPKGKGVTTVADIGSFNPTLTTYTQVTRGRQNLFPL